MLHALVRLIIPLVSLAAIAAAAEEGDLSNRCGSEDPRYARAVLPVERELPPFDLLPYQDTSRIDLIVFYTPEARQSEGAGNTDDMLARINTAIAGANTIMRESGVNAALNLVHAEELGRNNSSIDLETIMGEIWLFSDVAGLRVQYEADSVAFIVERMSPGAWGNIPLSASQALSGGQMYFGRLNFAANTLAHENGHTLGGMHHRPDQLPPSSDSVVPLYFEYSYGNHFIGVSGTHWRTVMSDQLYSLVAPAGQQIVTQNCGRFSGPNVIWDGVPTGDALHADNVRTFNYYAPFVASAYPRSTAPPEPTPGDATPTPTPSATAEPGSGTPTANPPVLTLRISKSRGTYALSGKCRSGYGGAYKGASLLVLRKGRQSGTQVGIVRCSSKGGYRYSTKRDGSYRVRDAATSVQTAWVKTPRR